MRKSRIGLKPPVGPVIGTYWVTGDIYDKMQREAPKFVAVINTERKYARVGLQECFVEFTAATDYATRESHNPKTYRLAHNLFMELFVPVDDEELSNKLGLEILASYD